MTSKKPKSGSGATGQRLSKTGFQNLGQERTKINDTLKDALTELSKTECMLGQRFIAKYD